MTKQDRQAILDIATKPIANPTNLAAECGDALRQDRNAIVTADMAAALLSWQAMQFDGQWDNSELAATFDFMKRATVLYT